MFSEEEPYPFRVGTSLRHKKSELNRMIKKTSSIEKAEFEGFTLTFFRLRLNRDLHQELTIAPGSIRRTVNRFHISKEQKWIEQSSCMQASFANYWTATLWISKQDGGCADSFFWESHEKFHLSKGSIYWNGRERFSRCHQFCIDIVIYIKSVQKSFIHWKLRGTYKRTSNSMKKTCIMYAIHDPRLWSTNDCAFASNFVSVLLTTSRQLRLENLQMDSRPSTAEEQSELNRIIINKWETIRESNKIEESLKSASTSRAIQEIRRILISVRRNNESNLTVMILLTSMTCLE
jgi:hypothetical protein